MKLIATSILILSVLFIVYANKTSSPLFLWSGKTLFNKQKVNIGTLKSKNFGVTLDKVCGLKVLEKDEKFLNKQIKPEVIIFYLKPHLSNTKFSILANVYNKKRSGGALSHVMNSVDASKSSLSVHYSSNQKSFIEDVISKFAKDLRSKYSSSNIILTSNKKEAVSHLGYTENQQWVPLYKFEEFISSNNGLQLLKNGQPDIIIYYMSEATDKSSVSQEDRLIGRINRVVNIETNGNFVGIFGSDFAKKNDNFDSIKKIKTREDTKPTEKETSFKMSESKDENDIAGSYFPAPIWESIGVVFVLLIAFLVGSSCTSAIQVPPKLLDEAMAKKKTK